MTSDPQTRPRYLGLPTFMRLPYAEDVSGADIAVLGVPFALAGILVGLTMPSRDMLVRETAAASARGRVFGFVYSGLDSGAAVGPLVVGLLLDHGSPRAVLWLVAALLLLAIVSAVAAKGRRG